MLLRIAAAAALLSSTTYHVSATSSRSLRASAPKSTQDEADTRELMGDNIDNFTPLPCNDNLTLQNCDGTILLSTLIATSLSEANAVMSSINATSYPPNMETIIPCGVCAIADITNRQVLSAPTGIDVQGMLYFPSSTHGTLETSHLLVQGILKIDPPDVSETGRVTIKLIGDDTDIYLNPHSHNAMACDRFVDGKCPMGKRPIAVAGGRLDIRGVDYDSMPNDCPSWVNLQDIWEEPIPADTAQYTSYITVDGDGNGNADT